MNLTPSQQANADQMEAQILHSVERVMNATHMNEEQSLRLLGAAEQHHGKGAPEETLVSTAIRLGSTNMN